MFVPNIPETNMSKNQSYIDSLCHITEREWEFIIV